YMGGFITNLLSCPTDQKLRKFWRNPYAFGNWVAAVQFYRFSYTLSSATDYAAQAMARVQGTPDAFIDHFKHGMASTPDLTWQWGPKMGFIKVKTSSVNVPSAKIMFAE